MSTFQIWPASVNMTIVFDDITGKNEFLSWLRKEKIWHDYGKFQIKYTFYPEEAEKVKKWLIEHGVKQSDQS